MTLLEEVKIRLRIKSDVFDSAEITPLIQACENDLKRVGISVQEDSPLIRQAIVLYCKGNFGFLEEAEKFQKAYDDLRDALALSGEYQDVL